MNTIKLNACIFCLLLLHVGVGGVCNAECCVVPAPHSVNHQQGSFRIVDDTEIVIRESDSDHLREHAVVLSEAIRRLWNVRVPVRVGGEEGQVGDILLELRDFEDSRPEGAYHMSVADSVVIRGADLHGVANGTATLLQLMGNADNETLARVEINDYPDASFRVFLADIARYRHSLQSLKQAVDWMWLYKINYLQLHMTDDQRFTFPSTAFPKLNEKTPDFTREELRELDHYAAARGVRIIPELEVPGHSGMMRGQHPEVFGQTPTELATLDSARAGIKTLLDEIIDVFQTATYIHIGCDEAYGVPHDAQRDLVNELHEYLESKGKKTIVWEGPHLGVGDNKVSTEVVHMAWRLVEFPPDQMLEAGYTVINASWDPLYIVDHYPRNNFTMAAPEQVYGVDRYTFKHFNPELSAYQKIEVPRDSDVIGFCLPWWEGREENFLIICPPRIAAMSARAWNPSFEIAYKDFAQRDSVAWRTIQRISTPVVIEADNLVIKTAGVFHTETFVSLQSDIDGDIYFTLDGKDPTTASSRYSQPFKITESHRIRAAIYSGDSRIGQISDRTFTCVHPIDNLALGKPVTSSVPSGPYFCVERLTDGGIDPLQFYVGYPTVPEPARIIVDLQAPTTMNQIIVYENATNRSYEDYTVSVSLDGVTFLQIGESTKEPKPGGKATYDFDAVEVRYIRVTTKGHKRWVFESFTRLIEIQAFNR